MRDMLDGWAFGLGVIALSLAITWGAALALTALWRFAS